MIETTSDSMREAREVYSPAAYRTALIYFVVIEMHQVNPMFRFSLAHFTKEFNKAIMVATTKTGGRSM